MSNISFGLFQVHIFQELISIFPQGSGGKKLGRGEGGSGPYAGHDGPHLVRFTRKWPHKNA